MNEMRKDEILDGRYRLIEKRGRGSYGEVWLARDLQINIDVAVKIYFALNDKGNEELRDEFETSFQLNHPNLLRSIYLGRDAERSYIVMPFCPTSSAQLIGCCNSHMMWEFVSDVAHGLAYLHEKGIVHHDIKPDNILMSDDGHYVISDFGISTQTRSMLRHQGEQRGYDDSGKAGGAIAYMGPEMFTEEPFSVANTDIWALGASMYEFVTGSLPFFGQGGAMQNNGAKLPEVSYDFVSHNLVDLIHSCLAQEPWDRPLAQEIAKYADMVLADEAPVPEWNDYFRACRKKELPADPEVPSKNRWWIGVAATAALLLGVGLAFYLGKGNEEEKLVNSTLKVEDTLQKAVALAQVKPVQATFLKVNGSEKPTVVTVKSYDTLNVVNILTDGVFTVSENLPQWLSLSNVTDTSFALHFKPNQTAEKRSKTLEIVSGDLVRKITIVQSPDKDKELKLRLTPAAKETSETPTHPMQNLQETITIKNK